MNLQNWQEKEARKKKRRVGRQAGRKNDPPFLRVVICSNKLRRYMALLPSAWRHEEVSDGKGPVSYPPLPEDETWRLPRKPKVEELRKFLPFYEGSIDVAPTIFASKGFVGLVLPVQESTVRPKEDYLEMTPEIPQRTPGNRVTSPPRSREERGGDGLLRAARDDSGLDKIRAWTPKSTPSARVFKALAQLAAPLLSGVSDLRSCEAVWLHQLPIPTWPSNPTCASNYRDQLNIATVLKVCTLGTQQKSCMCGCSGA